MLKGTDVELLVMNNSKKLVSAIPFIKGTKDKPIVEKDGTVVSYDNITAEMAIPPASDKGAWINSIKNGIMHLKKYIPKDYSLIATASGIYEEDELTHPDALIFGCMPDFDAWKKAENIPPCHSNKYFRSAGAHVHLSLPEELLTFMGKLRVAKWMDITHGIPMLLIDQSVESKERRGLYGRASSHRPKEYGIEYRALSNTWVRSKITAELIYYLSEDVIEIAINEKNDTILDKVGSEVIINTVNNSDYKTALDIYNSTIKKLISTRSRSLIEFIQNISFKSLEEEWSIK